MPRKVGNKSAVDLSELYKPFAQQIKAHTVLERFPLYGG